MLTIMQRWTDLPALASRFCGRYGRIRLFLLLAGMMSLPGCGGGNYQSVTQIPATLSGNWQFTMAAPSDGSFSGGLQGGFLLQNDNAVTGATTYSVVLSPNRNPTVCASGSAAITGTLTGQTVTLTAIAGAQTFAFSGTLSLDGSTMAGTYTSTDGSGCGTAQAGLQWNSVLIPPLTGSIQGIFHSTGGAAGLNEQEFLVSGALNEAANTGADNAAVTGNLNFLIGTTNSSDYPCLALASVKGAISGSSVFLQVIGTDGSTLGQIGSSSGSGLQTVTFGSTPGGYVLQSLAGAGYAVYAAACGGGSLQHPADSGNICLAVNSTSACQQPIALMPYALTFPSQAVDSSPTTQTITLANTYSSTLGSLTLTLTNNSGAGIFTETDTCGDGGVPSQGQPFVLVPQQSCVITIAFSPQDNCAAGSSSAQCLTATLTVASPNNDAIFMVHIVGGVSGSNSSLVPTPDVELHTQRVMKTNASQQLRYAGSWGPAQNLHDISNRRFRNAEGHAELL
jgi:hypothetical protein